MKKAMIVTVGTGTREDVDIAKPLVKTIRDSEPDFVCLVATDGSRTHADAIVERVPLVSGSFEISVLREYDDFQAVFRDINEIFKRLSGMGYSREDMEVDFTSGTKAMSSGAVLAAIYNQCASVKYITGERWHGVVQDGTEVFERIHPGKIFALYNLRLASRFIEELRFDAAGVILGQIRAPLLDDEDRILHDSLRAAAGGYGAWDLFNHKEAHRFLSKLTAGTANEHRFIPSQACLDMLERLSGREKPGDLLLLDLYNNASRRIREGKYDDAVARLYRTVELLAQVTLRERFGIDTGNVDIDLVPEPLRDRFRDHRDPRDGKIRIGLRAAYDVLEVKKDPVGQVFMNDTTLHGLLNRRNASILAHGLDPVSKRTSEKLMKSITNLLKVKYPDFFENAKALQFPWLSSP